MAQYVLSNSQSDFGHKAGACIKRSGIIIEDGLPPQPEDSASPTEWLGESHLLVPTGACVRDSERLPSSPGLHSEEGRRAAGLQKVPHAWHQVAG